jgi:copper oxidase (laccase) domain-containing protein
VALGSGATICTLDGNVHAAWSDASRGDLRPTGHGPDDGISLAELAGELGLVTGDTIDRVAWLTQVHGSEVRAASWEVHPRGSTRTPTLWHLGMGDALVSATPGVALCILTADCGPLALSSPEGIFGAVHAGWRGLIEGVVEQAVERMRALGATDVTAGLGPCIHTPCYEFGLSELDRVAAACGPAVRGTTSDGRPALDLVAGMTAAVTMAGARMVGGIDVCTSCSGGQFSHRARADTGRQALLVWSSAPVGAS